MIRRAYSYGQDEGQIIECDGAILNINDATLAYAGRSIELTRNEFKILQLLMRNREDSIQERLMRVLGGKIAGDRGAEKESGRNR